MLVEHVAREEITVSTSAKTLTSSNYAKNTVSGTAYDVIYADVHVMTANIRVTNDGSTTPVGATTGALWYAGQVKRVWGRLQLSRLQMIRDGSTDAEVVVEYWGRRGG